MKISRHFHLEEFTRSQLAVRHGIDNTPPSAIYENLRILARHMDTVRDLLGSPVHVSSGYRCPALNAKAKGSKTSTHMTGLACDFECPGFGTNTEVFNEIAMSGIRFDQLILEYGDAGWVHLGFGPTRRNERLSYDGKTYKVM